MQWQGVRAQFIGFRIDIIFRLVPRCRTNALLFWTSVLWMASVHRALPVLAPVEKAPAVSQAVDFLTRYGYLPQPDPGALRAELRRALLRLQRFARLQPTGVLDSATLALMRRRRCGMPDHDSERRARRYALQGQKWDSSNLTWSVRRGDGGAAAGMVRAQLQRAFAVWSGAARLSFEEARGGAADISVSFLSGAHGDGFPFDGAGSVLAHAFFPGEGIGGDAHFDADETWLAQQPEDEDAGVHLFAVAAHEIGHTLGLSHSSSPGSLMFPYYQMVKEDGVFRLPQDDVDGIRHLYGIKDFDNQSTMPSIEMTTDTQTTESSQISSNSTMEGPTTEMFSNPPEICNTSIDAISIIRREIFIFKGRYFWRMNMNLTMRAGYPVSIDRFWTSLPTNIQKIDAVYERPSDTKIVFYIGQQYWLFSGNQLEPGYPRPLADIGLPLHIRNIDAAFVWGHNGRIYLLAGKQYWKLDKDGKAELDYPRNIAAIWRGVPNNIDSAFQWSDGNTYFFKGTKFWKFNDAKMKASDKYPMDVTKFWFKCPTTDTTEVSEEISTVSTTTQGAIVNITDVFSSAHIHQIFSNMYLFFCFLLHFTIKAYF